MITELLEEQILPHGILLHLHLFCSLKNNRTKQWEIDESFWCHKTQIKFPFELIYTHTHFYLRNFTYIIIQSSVSRSLKVHFIDHFA